jgi:hypothetical protein
LTQEKEVYYFKGKESWVYFVLIRYYNLLFFIYFFQRLLAEREKLVERNEELQSAQLNNGAMMMDGSPTTGVDTLDMIPPEIRYK